MLALATVGSKETRVNERVVLVDVQPRENACPWNCMHSPRTLAWEWCIPMPLYGTRIRYMDVRVITVSREWIVPCMCVPKATIPSQARGHPPPATPRNSIRFRLSLAKLVVATSHSATMARPPPLSLSMRSQA